MISQKCPRCYSGRIRRGYRQTPLLSKLFFRYHLLCDSCNWEFKGFAVPGTVSKKPNKKETKSKQGYVQKPSVEEKSNLEKKLLEFNQKIEQMESSNKNKDLEEIEHAKKIEKPSTKSPNISQNK